MNARAQFAQIGETPEYAAPALRRSLSEIVAEYDEKAESIGAAIAAFKDAETAINTAACIGGTYGSKVFSTDPHLYEKDVQIALLRSAWKHIYEGLDIAKIASARDREQLELKLTTPLPFNLANIAEVFGAYLLDPRFHVLKGLAECFCDLDPAYKSHSRVRIGVTGLPKRIIVQYATGWNSWGRKRVEDTLNALAVYRGEPRYNYRQFEDMLDEAKRHGEADFNGGRIKTFLNGNAHLIFDKHGLLDINRALAEFYGEVLPDAPSETEARRPSTEVARDLQFYPTPRKAAKTVIDALNLTGGETILEPSCGDGQIMDLLAEWHNDPDERRYRSRLIVTGVEYDAGRAAQAKAKGHHVMTANFLQVAPDARFDAIIMNPPFYGQHYKKHLDHAIKFLRPGGRLVCILPASAYYDHGNTVGEWHDLPVGSFAESGTNIPTGYCTYYAPK
tara:strand:+ start:1632 stop:2975 length:1344 start_codon:yes stop_codon:yes gene_type:complete